jgi:uncharacterized protein (TIGR02757 family)
VRSQAALKRQLDALVRGCDRATRRDQDPVGFVHRYRQADDREVVGLVASSLAFGNVVAVRRSVGRVLDALGPSPAATIDRASERELAGLLRGFVHRVWRGPHLAGVLHRAGSLRRREGSLGAAMQLRFRSAGGDLREALSRFAGELRGAKPSRNVAHLVSDPMAGSACKRLLLYLRWMVRREDGVDLGLWPLPPSALVIPLDTHVHRIARNLGLTVRDDPSWRTAVEVTDALRRFDPDDPVKYDFALCHLGVSRDCPSRRDPVKCDRCVLRTVCLRWAD